MSKKSHDETDNKSAIKSDPSDPIPDPKKVLRKTKKDEQPEAAVAEPTKTKKKGTKKAKYEELPEIADYEKQELEKYEESEFTPTKHEKEVPEYPQKKHQRGVKSESEPIAEQPGFKKQEVKRGAVEEVEPQQVGTRKPQGTLQKIAFEKPELQQIEATEFDPIKKLRKVEKTPLQEPEQAQPVPKPKMKRPVYPELPEIPDYDRPDLEIYEESEFDPTKHEKEFPEYPPRKHEKLMKPEPEPIIEKPGFKKQEVKREIVEPVEPKQAGTRKPQGDLPEIPDGENPILKSHLKEPESTEAPKAKGKPKRKPSDLPEIPDYEKPELEKYEPSEFDPSKPDKEVPETLKKKHERAAKPTTESVAEKPGLKNQEVKREPTVEVEPKNAGTRKPQGDLPEIPDYEKPQLEKYEPSDFDPSKEPKLAENPTVEAAKPAQSGGKPKSKPKSKQQDLPEIPDPEPTQLEKYEKTPFEPTPKEPKAVENGEKEKPVEKVKPKDRRKSAVKFDDFVPGKVFQLKPTAKAKPKPKDVEAEATINKPKAKPSSSTGESADAQIKTPRKKKAPTSFEESASKDIVIHPDDDVEMLDTSDPNSQSLSPDIKDLSPIDNIEDASDAEVNTTQKHNPS